MTFNPKALIDKNPMTGLQYSTIFICFLMNMLDGMDVLVISYTAPAIAKAWDVSPQALGTVFSAGLFGMTIGTLFLAPFADKIGRKAIILISGIIMGVCIYLTSYATSITELLIYRFVSGLGIGSMLASTASLASEYTPNKTRDFWVSFVISGYPIGAVIAGLVAAKVIPTDGWQQMFRIAGIASMFSVPLILFFLSESIDFYLRTQPQNALEKLNKILTKMNIQPLESLPIIEKIKSKLPVDQLLKTDFKKPTLQLWAALFMAFAALYFLTSWIPKLAKDAGLSMELAIYAGTVFNIGAFFGIITQGYFSSKYGLKKTLGIILVLTGVLMASFGLFIGSDVILLILALLGFGIQGGFVGLYALSARLYPTEFRTTGVGWAMGAGRLGGIVGPMIGGLLIGAGLGIATNFLIFAIPAALSGIITSRIDSKEIS
ncbi:MULTISPECIES: MFS transporter [Emticicia]|uniref:MFS transporter n=1 Tax=Emticicia TaxID=312278 RepID=UPI0007D8BF0A|nr:MULTISPECIES: MFS transporter [Emticicia]